MVFSLTALILAAAAPIEDEASQFAFDPRVPGADTCVVVPAELTDPKACEGFDTTVANELEQMMSSKGRVIAVALARRDDAVTFVMSIALPFPNASSMTQEDLVKFIEGSRKAIEQRVGVRVRAGTGKHAQRTLTIGTSPAASFLLTADVPPDHPLGFMGEMVNILIPREKDFVILQIASDHEHRAQLGNDVRAIITTIEAPPPEGAENFGWTDVERFAFRAGEIVARVGFWVIGGVIAFFAFRATRKKPQRNTSNS